MKHLAVILTVLFLFIAERALSEPLDSLTRRTLSVKLEEYFGALKHESLPVQKEECDFLIASAEDSLVRQFVAVTIYDRYLNSPIMGTENVAVHVFDRWFKTGAVKMYSPAEYLAAEIFAEFNRQSLIGNRAPELVMESLDGDQVSLWTDEDGERVPRILLFYDSDCPKCKVESILLRNFINTGISRPVEVVCVYTGDDRQKWMSYISQYLDIKADAVHLWDPSVDSDYQRKYGVLKTPMMLLIDADGVIVGRNLDTEALGQLLDRICGERELEYGSDESVALFDGLLSLGGSSPDREDVVAVADHIASATLARGDTLMFRQLAGDFLYYLVSRRGEGIKEGLDVLIDDHILSRPDIWKSPDDSLKVTGLAAMMDDLLDRAVPGTRIGDIKVPAVRIVRGKERNGHFRLDKVGGKRNIIVFHTEGCPVCDSEKQAATALSKSERGVRALFVNMDEIFSSDSVLAAQLLDSFDLSALPLVVETDRGGRILHRYFSLLD